MDINKVLESGDETLLRQMLERAKALAKKGEIISLIDFLCPEDKPLRLPMGVKGVKKREHFEVVETKKGHKRKYHDD